MTSQWRNNLSIIRQNPLDVWPLRYGSSSILFQILRYLKNYLTILNFVKSSESRIDGDTGYDYSTSFVFKNLGSYVKALLKYIKTQAQYSEKLSYTINWTVKELLIMILLLNIFLSQAGFQVRIFLFIFLNNLYSVLKFLKFWSSEVLFLLYIILTWKTK